MKISELTVGELKKIIRDLLDSAIFELEQLLPDPNEGKALKPEFVRSLETAREESIENAISHEALLAELGLDDD